MREMNLKKNKENSCKAYDEQFSKFIEEMPVIVKNYSHIMSVSYILQNCCG